MTCLSYKLAFIETLMSGFFTMRDLTGVP